MLNIYQLQTLRSNVLFSVCASFSIFCLGDLFTDVSGKLKSPPMIVFLLISPFMSINIWLIFWGAPMKNWCLNSGAEEDSWESPWTARRSNQSILKEISPGCSMEGLEAETPVLWPPDVESWLIWIDSDAAKDWGQEEKGTTEDEMAGWHHQLDGHGFGWTPGVGDGQGGLACCGSWGRKESDTTTERLNWTEGFFL